MIIMRFIFLLLSLVIFTQSQCTTRTRHSWVDLSAADQKLYIDAIVALKQNGQYDDFARIHNERVNAKYAHGDAGFFPWHRELLITFENAIRKLGPRFSCFTLPFWAWERDAGREAQSPVLMALGGTSTRGCLTTGPFANWNDYNGDCLQRQMSPNFFFVGETRLGELITTQSSYGGRDSGWRVSFESAPHSAIHNYVGGHMASMISANDPIFWLHHCNVDRIWWIWQDCHGLTTPTVEAFPRNPYRENMPYQLAGSRYSLFRSIHPNQVFSITDLKYDYPRFDSLVTIINTLVPNVCQWTYYAPSGTTKRTLSEELAVNVTKRQWSDDDDDDVDEDEYEYDEDDDYDEDDEDDDYPYDRTYYGFSDTRVERAYVDVCLKWQNPWDQLHETVLAECHICKTEKPKIHATDAWIKKNHMQNVPHKFVPVCAEINRNEQTEDD